MGNDKSYSGDESGIWNVAIYDDGTIIGLGRHSSGLMFKIGGLLQPTGDAFFSFLALGTTTVSSDFEAVIDLDGTVTATWTDGTSSGTASGARVPAATIDMADYWPLTLGHYRIYDRKSHADIDWQYQEKQEIIGTEPIHGVDAVQQAYYDSSYDDGSMTDVLDYDLFSLSTESIDAHGLTVEISAWGDDLGLYELDPPLQIARTQSTGETYITQSTETQPDGVTTSTVIVSTTLLGFEDVSVTAGDFTNAAMFLMIYQKDSVIEPAIEWSVTGIGSVRTVSEGGIAELNDWGPKPTL